MHVNGCVGGLTHFTTITACFKINRIGDTIWCAVIAVGVSACGGVNVCVIQVVNAVGVVCIVCGKVMCVCIC